MVHRIFVTLSVLPVLLLPGGCASRRSGLSPLGTPCSIANARLKQAWRTLHEAVQTGACAAEPGLRCEELKARIERLSIDCPTNPDVVMANALLAYESRNLLRSQQLLDNLFQLGVRYPEAGVLRARIAIEQGNLPFALRFLEQQVHQSGDDGGLRETYASTLYLSGRLEESRAQLLAARQLGAPAWRVAYGLGLIEESAGKFSEARQRYEESLQAKPGWKPAESRLRGLVISGRVSP